jgi:hypothetical protein
LTELDGLSQWNNPKKTLSWFLWASPIPILGGPRSLIIFTGAHPVKTSHAPYAKAFRDYIRVHKLGTVREMAPTKNKNGGNYVRVYVWVVNQAKTAAWKEANPFIP